MRTRTAPVAATPVRVAIRDLCIELAPDRVQDTRSDSGRMTVPGLHVDVGQWEPASIARGCGRAEAAVIVTGLLLADTRLAGRVATQVFGPGDVLPLRPDGDGQTLAFTVLAPLTVVPVDDRLLALVQHVPVLAALLVQASARQLRRAATQQAISQLSRIELRLLAIMWHLADRWGRVTPDGISLELDLTHVTLGQLVGARRPTVSLALKVLAAEGTLVRQRDRWILAPGSRELLHDTPVSLASAAALHHVLV